MRRGESWAAYLARLPPEEGLLAQMSMDQPRATRLEAYFRKMAGKPGKFRVECLDWHSSSTSASAERWDAVRRRACVRCSLLDARRGTTRVIDFTPRRAPRK